MKARLVRVTLAGAVAVLAVAPIAPAHAWTCSPELLNQPCATIGLVCRQVPEKYQQICNFS